jgi:cell division protein FtsI/penicillin-binding protein 2
MAARDEIVWRGALVYLIIGLLAVAIFVRILILQYVQRGKWADMSEKYVFKTAEMPANRGDILTSDDRLLASSVPYYTIYMDTRSSGMSSATWSDGIKRIISRSGSTPGRKVSFRLEINNNRGQEKGRSLFPHTTKSRL